MSENKNNKSRNKKKKTQVRRLPRLRGQGGYLSDAYDWVKKNTPSGTFSKVGGSLLGAPGAALGSAISNLVGFGDYKVNYNALVPLPMGQPVPSFGDMRNATIIEHREYIQDIIVPAVPATFTNIAFPINPGQSRTFPFLSQIAAQYDSYQLLGAVFQFKSLSSQTSTSLPLGSVVMCTNYDSADDLFVNKLSMENTQYAVSAKPSEDMIHPIECAPNLTVLPRMYVRSGSVPSGKDIRMYDLGNFQIATTGLAGTADQVIGELWVTYKVALHKPILNGLGCTLARSAWYELDIATVASAGSAYYGTLPAALLPVSTSFPVSPTLSAAGVLTFPPNIVGRFMIFWLARGTTGVLANAIALTVTNPGVRYTYVSSINSGATIYENHYLVHFTVQTPSPLPWTLTITAGSIPPNLSRATVYITEMNPNFSLLD